MGKVKPVAPAGTSSVCAPLLSESLSPQLLRYVSVWDKPFGAEDLAGRLAEIHEAAKSREAERTGELVRALYAATLDQFLSDYRRSDAEIEEAPVV